jgi:hypothetical protein
MDVKGMLKGIHVKPWSFMNDDIRVVIDSEKKIWFC